MGFWRKHRLCQQLLKLTLLSTTNFSVYRFCTNYYPANRRSWGQITCGSVFCCGASTDQLLRCFALFFLIRCRNDKRNRSKVLAEILGKTEGGLNLKLVGVSPTTVIDLGPPPDARLSGSLAAEIRYGPCKGWVVNWRGEWVRSATELRAVSSNCLEVRHQHLNRTME